MKPFPAFHMNIKRSSATALTGLACTIIFGTASAQTATQAETELASDTWKFSTGVGLMSRSRYPGSSETKTAVLPMVNVNYGRFFIGGMPDAGSPLGVGATLLQNGPWRAGLSVGADLEKPRKESDSSRLSGLGDVAATAYGTVFASYDTGRFAARANVITDIGGKGEGTRANLDLEGRINPLPKLVLSAGPGVTFADRKYTQTFFGVTDAQSLASGLARHEATAGINSIRFAFGANYQLTPNWNLGARVIASTLRGDAADSPVTEKKSQTRVGLFANYRF